MNNNYNIWDCVLFTYRLKKIEVSYVAHIVWIYTYSDNSEPYYKLSWLDITIPEKEIVWIVKSTDK